MSDYTPDEEEFIDTYVSAMSGGCTPIEDTERTAEARRGIAKVKADARNEVIDAKTVRSPSATNSTPLVLFALRIAADLVGTCGSDVQTTTHQGIDGQTDSVTISTDDYTVTVTPAPTTTSTPPPYVGMTHPPM